MKYLFAMLSVSCATVPQHSEAWPAANEMEQGTLVCAQLCLQYGRTIEEYRYDGKCICRSFQIHELIRPEQHAGAHQL